jgi:hypothetical protein
MDREDNIRLIAYHIWEEQGCCDGRDLDHWLVAETIWQQMKEKGTARAKPREKVEVANASPRSTPATKSTATFEKKGSRQNKKK